MTQSSTKSNDSGINRRRAQRRPILDTFSIFVVVPKKGVHRLRVHDLSEFGVGFDFDTEGESTTDVAIKKGESFDIHLYLNQSLYLSLSVEAARIEEVDGIRRIGAEFKDKRGKSHKAFLSFLEMLDSLIDSAQIVQTA